MTTSIPNIIHPVTYTANGMQIRIASYFQLTNAQAKAIAMHSYRTRKWTKADAKKVHTILWTGDRETAAMFG